MRLDDRFEQRDGAAMVLSGLIAPRRQPLSMTEIGKRFSKLALTLRILGQGVGRKDHPSPIELHLSFLKLALRVIRESELVERAGAFPCDRRGLPIDLPLENHQRVFMSALRIFELTESAVDFTDSMMNLGGIPLQSRIGRILLCKLGVKVQRIF